MKQTLSNIHPEAKIADNVKIEPFVSIAKDVEIGEGTWIAPNVVIMDGARIGKNCKIFPGAVIAAIPQDLKFEGEYTTVEIGDNTSVREYVTINKATKAKVKTRVGSNVLLMAYSHVAHDCCIGNHCIIGNGVQIAGEVEIDDWAIVSGLSAIHQFVHIGQHAFISGGSLVRNDVPPFVKAAHEPLAYAGINSVGLRRRKFTNGEINIIQDIYRILFQKGHNRSNALEIIRKDFDESPQRQLIIEFVEKSTRGLIKGPRILDKE